MIRRLVLSLVLLVFAATATVVAPASAAAPEVDAVYGWEYHQLVNNTDLDVEVLTGNFGGDAATDVVIYGAGAEPDGLWIGRTGQRGEAAFLKRPMPVNGYYQPVVGDFGGDGHDDILWYAPGPAPDPLWISQVGPENGFSTSRTVRIDGTYRPTVVHDRSSGAKDRILWYAPGTAPDAYWTFPSEGAVGGSSGAPRSAPLKIGGHYQVLAGTFEGPTGIEQLFFYAPGPAPDYYWAGLSPTGSRVERKVVVNGAYQAAVLPGGTSDRIYWFASGAAPDRYWVFGPNQVIDRPVVQDPTMVGLAERFGDEGVIVRSPGARERLVTGDANGASSRWLASPAHDITAAVPVMGNFDGDVDGYTDIFWFGRGKRHDELWYGIPSADGTKSTPDGVATTPFTPR